MPNPWLILGVVLALGGAALAGYTYGTKHEARAWEAATAKLQAEAAQTLATANAAAAAKDQSNAELARNLDEKHAKELEAINAARDSAGKRLADSVRNLTRCRSSGPGELPVAASDPGIVADDATGGDAGLSAQIGASLAGIGADANKLAATVRQCVEWANQVGR